MADLKIKFCGLELENPFLLAPAPPADNAEMVARGLEMGWAGVVLKTTSVESEEVILKYPMMTGYDFEEKKVIGLGNIDLISERHIDQLEKDVVFLKKRFPQKMIGVSIMGKKKEDWETLVKRLKAAGVDYIECSFSCPQGTLGAKPGAMLGQDANASRTVASWVKNAAGKTPVSMKLTSHVADITEIAQAVKEAGSDAVTAINTVKALMGIDLETFIPRPNVGGKSTYSGYSGPAIKPIALRCVAEISRKVGITVSATGGITTWQDAAEFLLCGARSLQVCTAVMRSGYRIIEDFTDGLKNYLDEKGIQSVEEIVGKSLPYIVSHDELPRPKIRSRINLETCEKCDQCYIACRDGGHQAIELDENRLPKVDDEKCVGCGMCYSVCPVFDCIKLVAIE